MTPTRRRSRNDWRFRSRTLESAPCIHQHNVSLGFFDMFRFPAGASQRVVAWQTGCWTFGENHWNGDGGAGVKVRDTCTRERTKL
jgi:hypothetical protein